MTRMHVRKPGWRSAGVRGWLADLVGWFFILVAAFIVLVAGQS